MTLELTPAQIQILHRLVSNEAHSADNACQWLQRTDKRPAMLADPAMAEAKAKFTELESLRDLLTKSTAVLIYHP